MTKEEHRIGITPILQRLAYHFVCRGVGTYPMEGHPYYDEAVVKELYPWVENPDVEGEHSGALVVEFYRDGERERYVEFGIRRIGAGGREAIKLVKP